jgi:sugar lactone lactonase YvrE
MFLFGARAQIYDTNNIAVQTFAGSGFSGYLDGQGQQTMFDNPAGVVADSQGNLFVADSHNNRVREITPSGIVTTFAGGGVQLPAFGTNASLILDYGEGNTATLAIDHSNVLWITAPPGFITIHPNGYVSATTNAPGISVPSGICFDSQNNLYYSDVSGNRIYRWKTNGTVEVFAGSGNQGAADGNGLFTSFNQPAALSADAADNIYVWDSWNQLIRRISQNRDVVTIAGGATGDTDGTGTSAGFTHVRSMYFDNTGNLILAGGSPGAIFIGSYIRKMTASTNVTTIAGSFDQTGFTNGTGSLARFSGVSGVCVSQGAIFIGDTSNQRIRKITFDPAPQPVSGANLQLQLYPGLQIIGEVGRAYQIQTSPDMSNWTAHATILLNSSPFLWIDQNPVTGSKFYRALLLP